METTKKVKIDKKDIVQGIIAVLVISFVLYLLLASSPNSIAPPLNTISTTISLTSQEGIASINLTLSAPKVIQGSLFYDYVYFQNYTINQATMELLNGTIKPISHQYATNLIKIDCSQVNSEKSVYDPIYSTLGNKLTEYLPLEIEC